MIFFINIFFHNILSGGLIIMYCKSRRILLALIIMALIISQVSIGTTANILGIPTNQETAHGTITYKNTEFDYAWFNTTLLDGLLFNYHMPVGLPSIMNPIQLFHLKMKNNSEVFVSNSLIAVEIYNDINQNNILDADYTSGSTELMYLLYPNASVNYMIEGPEKHRDNCFTWSVRYDQPQIIGNSDPVYSNENTIIELIFDYFEFRYNYTFIESSNDVQGIVKLDINIGKVISATKISLNGKEAITIPKQWGLSLLFSLSTSYSHRSRTYEAYENRLTYIKLGDGKKDFFEARLYDNYTYNDNGVNKTYPAYCVFTTEKSISPEERQVLTTSTYAYQFANEFINSILESSSQLYLDPITATCSYRIEYPVWQGLEIRHDPIFKIYNVELEEVEPVNYPETSLMLLLIPIIGAVVAIIIYERTKHK